MQLISSSLITSTGCLKKAEFYRIVNLYTGAPPALGNLLLLFFGRFLNGIKQSQGIFIGKYRPTLPNFG